MLLNVPLMNLKIVIFCGACLSGAIVAVLWRNFEHRNRQQTIKVSSTLHETTTRYKKWLTNQGLEGKKLPEEWISYKREGYHRNKLETEADFLKKKVRILCCVKSKSRPHAKAVKETWGQNCNTDFYFGDFTDDEIPIIEIHKDNKLCSLINHIWLKYKNKFDWLFLTDDQTFSIIENLRHYVAPLNTSKAYYLGHPVQRPYFSTSYNLLDAGIVMSRESIFQLYTKLQNENCTSKTSSSCIDEEIGFFLKGVAKVADTRDSKLRGRFNPFSPSEMIIPGSIGVFNPYWRTSLFLSSEGMDSCSDEAVSFHGVSHIQMHLLHYLTHSLAVFKHSLNGLGNAKAPDNLFLLKKHDEARKLYAAKSSVKLISGNLFKNTYHQKLSLPVNMKENEI